MNQKPLDLTFVRIANRNHELRERNQKARLYSLSVEAKRKAEKLRKKNRRETLIVNVFTGSVLTVSSLAFWAALIFIG